MDAYHAGPGGYVMSALYVGARSVIMQPGAAGAWDIQPSTMFDPRAIKSDLALSCPPAMRGMWFDPLTRLLYVSCPGVDPQPYLQTPLIHVWHVK